MPPSLAAIDYGSKLAGTTALALWPGQGDVALLQSSKKQDADIFLQKILQEVAPDILAWDAPLSLPGVYRGLPGCTDYFYRAGDRAVQAMSPMFLGGLTARAMRLCANLQLPNTQVLEAYPGGLARLLALPKERYKQKETAPSELLPLLQAAFPPEIILPTPRNWHQFDALLALLTGWRFTQGLTMSYGDPAEGLIWI